MSIKPLPKLEAVEPIQCVNCGAVITTSTERVLLDKENDLYICEHCYKGLRKYTLEREHLKKDGNIALLKALDKGTAREYKNISNFVDILTPCYTKDRG